MTTQREERLVIRIAAPLLDELEAAASAAGRSLASEARRILVDWAAARVVARERDHGIVQA